jgi:hypothetical protein
MSLLSMLKSIKNFYNTTKFNRIHNFSQKTSHDQIVIIFTQLINIFLLPIKTC